MNEILFPALAIGGVGLGLGALLAVASKVFHVEVDERVEKITGCLSGANCGGCGYAGCGAYAAAIVNDGAPINCCASGGQSAVNAIAEIMGVEATAMEPVRAVVMCSGTAENAPDAYEYYGIADCLAASKLQGGGHKSCNYGCLGYGKCVTACSEGGISIVNGIAVIDSESCIGCGSCKKVCPKNIIDLVPVKNKIYVKCKSCDKGPAMKQKCSLGCIGCRLCEKACPEGAITVNNNVASIDYGKCTQCGLCAEKCPRKIIINEGAEAALS
ncbi:MAG: RnfABCDGE type electron transport complex subunit B [Clostridia bacterium]